MIAPGAARRARAEDARRRVERQLRPAGPAPADRDRGLEEAWARRLAGARLVAADAELTLAADRSYRARFPDGAESGTWRLTSCVGRASLVLAPAGAGEYGFILSREEDGVALNGVPHRAV